jgi:hypothetical protein
MEGGSGDSPSRAEAEGVNLAGTAGCCSSSSKSKRFTSGALGVALGGGAVAFADERLDELCDLDGALRSPSSESPASYSSKSPPRPPVSWKSFVEEPLPLPLPAPLLLPPPPPDPPTNESLPNPPYRDPPADWKLGPPPPPDPSLPVPVYLLRFALALRRSVLTLSRSDKSSASSFERLRTINPPSGLEREIGKREGKRTVDSLIFARFVRVMEVTENLDETQMSPRIVNHTFRAILNEIPKTTPSSASLLSRGGKGTYSRRTRDL